MIEAIYWFSTGDFIIVYPANPYELCICIWKHNCFAQNDRQWIMAYLVQIGTGSVLVHNSPLLMLLLLLFWLICYPIVLKHSLDDLQQSYENSTLPPGYLGLFFFTQLGQMESWVNQFISPSPYPRITIYWAQTSQNRRPAGKKCLLTQLNKRAPLETNRVGT